MLVCLPHESFSRHDSRVNLVAFSGAETLADQLGENVIAREPNEWFVTEKRRSDLAAAVAAEEEAAKQASVDASHPTDESIQNGGDVSVQAHTTTGVAPRPFKRDAHAEAVGALAIDMRGYLASATSSAGWANKDHGHVRIDIDPPRFKALCMLLVVLLLLLIALCRRLSPVNNTPSRHFLPFYCRFLCLVIPHK